MRDKAPIGRGDARMRDASGSRRLRSLVVCLVLLASTAPLATPESDAKEAQLEALRERITGLRAQMRSKSGERTELTLGLQSSEQQIGRLARKLRVLEGRLMRQRQLLNDLRDEQAEQQSALAGQRAALARQVRAAYAMGRQERLRILLNQQDPATVSRMMVYYDYLNRARAEKMRAIRQRMSDLAETEKDIQREELMLAQLHDEQQRELAALNRSQVERQAVVAQLTRELQDQGRQLDRLQTDERGFESLPLLDCLGSISFPFNDVFPR